jgi:hypothetical protein
MKKKLLLVLLIRLHRAGTRCWCSYLTKETASIREDAIARSSEGVSGATNSDLHAVMSPTTCSWLGLACRRRIHLFHERPQDFGMLGRFFRERHVA